MQGAPGRQRIPAPQICEQARISRDPRFDGLFFTAVTTTRIYCRPVCPVRTVRSENVRYYVSAAAAEDDGFRPCLRCRPELAPAAWNRGDAALERALKLIDEGYLAEHSLAALARQVSIGERQLRRVFVERLGAGPHSVHATRRLLFAKQLLTDTALPITQIALEAGFSSVRRFNATFRKLYNMPPSELRRLKRQAGAETLTLRLNYRPPYDFEYLLDELRSRAIPGFEVVDDSSYARTFGTATGPGWLRVDAWPGGKAALRATLHCPQAVGLLNIVNRLRRMFDLDAEPDVIQSALSRDLWLQATVARHAGLRLPGPWDGFESIIRALIEQRCGYSAAKNVHVAIRRLGVPVDADFPAGLELLFPPPTALASAGRLSVFGSDLPWDLARQMENVSRAILDSRLDLSATATLEGFLEQWLGITRASRSSAHDIALRALGHPDALPASDSNVRVLAATNGILSAAQLRAHAETWRPWRAYALMHLIRGAEERHPVVNLLAARRA